jgi:hypothetical protein
MPVAGDATDYLDPNVMGHMTGDPSDAAPTKSRFDPATWAAIEIIGALAILWLLGFRLNGLT